MQFKKLSLIKMLMGGTAIIGGVSALAVLATSCGNDGEEKSITGTWSATPLQVNTVASGTVTITGHNGADLKNVTITAPDLGINFGSGTIVDGKKTFTITGVPTSAFSGNILASDANNGLSCQVFISIIGAQSISATINGDFQVGETCTGSIVVTGVNGVDLTAVTLSQISINGLAIDNGTIQDNVKTYLISGTPTTDGNTNIIITGLGVTANVVLNISPKKSLSLSATGSFRAGVASSGTFVITSNYGADLTAVSPIQFNVPGLTCDNGDISGSTKIFTVTGTPTQNGEFLVTFGYGIINCYSVLGVSQATSISLTTNGTYKAGVACSNCSIVVNGFGGADLSNVTISTFGIPGLSVDNGTVSGTTKTFNVTGTPTSSDDYNIVASNPSSSLYQQVILHVEEPDVVQYRANGTNWPGWLSGTLSYSLDSTNHIYTVTNSSPNFSADANFKFPSTVTEAGQTYDVTTIGEFAFVGDTGFTRVDFNQITTIGYGAFQNCNLTKVNIGMVQEIGDYAFTGCRIQEIGVDPGNPIYRMNGIASSGFIQRRSDTTTITSVCGNHGGIACGYLTSCFPNGTTAIADYAFYDCERLTLVDLSTTGIQTIGDYAFQDCDTLREINLGYVTSIGDEAFSRCNLSLIYVNTGNSEFTRVGTSSNGFIKKKSDPAHAFSAVCGTKGGIACGDITIDDNNAMLGDYAFYGCAGITSINFSSSAVGSGLDFIKGCTNLSSVSIVGNSLFLPTGDDGWDGVGPTEGYKTIYASSLTQGNTFRNNVILSPYNLSWQVVVVQS